MATFLTQQQRAANRRKVLQFLKEQALAELPFASIDEGAPYEIVGVAENPDGSPKMVVNGNFWAIVWFKVAVPAWKDEAHTELKGFEYPLTFNRNSSDSHGMVAIPIINGKIALTYEYRIGAGGFQWGFPRGFPHKTDTGLDHGRGATAKLWPELKEEVLADHAPAQVEVIGQPFENSSTHAVRPDVIIAQYGDLSAEELKGLGGQEKLIVELWSLDKVKSEIGHKLIDQHTLSAWALAQTRLEKLLS